MTDRRRDIGGQVGGNEVVEIELALTKPIEVEKPRAGLADVTCYGRQEAARAHDISPARLALQRLSKPQERRTAAVEMCGLFNEPCGHPGRCFSPCRRSEERRVGKAWGPRLPSGRTRED